MLIASCPEADVPDLQFWSMHTSCHREEDSATRCNPKLSDQSRDRFCGARSCILRVGLLYVMYENLELLEVDGTEVGK